MRLRTLGGSGGGPGGVGVSARALLVGLRGLGQLVKPDDPLRPRPPLQLRRHGASSPIYPMALNFSPSVFEPAR